MNLITNQPTVQSDLETLDVELPDGRLSTCVSDDVPFGAIRLTQKDISDRESARDARIADFIAEKALRHLEERLEDRRFVVPRDGRNFVYCGYTDCSEEFPRVLARWSLEERYGDENVLFEWNSLNEVYDILIRSEDNNTF